MGIIDNALLLEKGLRAEFLRAFDNGEKPADVMPIIMETRSTSDSEKYGWLGEVPQLREWVDERQLSGLKDFDYTIPNKDYESTLQVNKNAMDDDQLGATKIRIRDLASRALTHPRKLLFDQIALGPTALGYDGVAFFSASHPESGTNQDNIVTGTSGSPYTTAQFKTDFCSARERMRGFTDDQGEPRNEGDMKLLVVAPESMECVVDEVLTAKVIAQTTNVLVGAAEKLISSRLPSDEDWYLFATSGEIKPFVKQLRAPIKFESQEKGERAFMRKELLFGVDYRVGFGFGVWYKAIKINN